jgi:hypothetical protein
MRSEPLLFIAFIDRLMSQFTILLNLVKIAAYCSLTFILHRVGPPLILRNNFSKTKVMSSRKNDGFVYECKLCHSFTTRSDHMEDLGVFMDSKLHFHNHANYTFSRCIKLLSSECNLFFPTP